MITRPAAFRVYGEPAPKGSLAGRCLTHPKLGQVCKKLAKVVLTEQVERGRYWRKQVEKAAAERITEQAGEHQPIKATFVFAVTRTHAARDRAYPATRSAQGVGGDMDKMVRLVLDALESCGVLKDDAQVVRWGETCKVYADAAEWTDRGGPSGMPGAYIRVEPVGWVPDPLPLVVPHG